MTNSTDKTGSLPAFGCEGSSNPIRGYVTISISILGIFANASVLIVAIKHWLKYGLCQKLISILAFFDILFSTLQLITSVPYIWTCSWLYGERECKIITCVMSSSSCISVGIIVIIAVERYVGIIHPFSRGLTFHQVFVGCFTCAFASIVMSIPNYFHTELRDGDQCLQFWEFPDIAQIYTWSLFCVSFIFPIITLTVLYYNIIKHVFMSNKLHQNIAALTKIQREQKEKDNKRIVRLLIAILVAFILLVLPNKIYWLMEHHKTFKNVNKDSMNTILLLANVFYSIHITINPFIYAIIDARFRANLLSLLGIKRVNSKGTTYKAYKRQTESTVTVSEDRV